MSLLDATVRMQLWGRDGESQWSRPAYLLLPLSPAHAPLVLYFGRRLRIREFWMTCCVLFHPRSLEGARTGCT